MWTPNALGRPLAERLVYIENSTNSAHLALNLNKNSYSKKEKLTLKINNEEVTSLNIQTELSLSVTQLNSQSQNSFSDNIKAWLLLNSDLRGDIKNPNFFFEIENDIQRRFLLDALMLTHGWRRFLWQDLLKNEKKELEFTPEKGIIISGKTTRLQTPKKGKKTKIFITILGNNPHQENMFTGDDGRFSFGPFVIYDKVFSILQAEVPKKKDKGSNTYIGRDKYVHILLDPPEISPEFNPDLEKRKPLLSNRKALDYLYESFSRKGMLADEGMPSITIPNITIRTKEKSIREKLNEMTSYGNPDERFIIDSLDLKGVISVFDVLKRIPGTYVRGAYPYQRIVFPYGSVRYYYNGIPVAYDDVRDLLAQDVFFIDIIKNSFEDMHLFGLGNNFYNPEGEKYIIAIYTTRLSERSKRRPGIKSSFIEGFYNAKEFYSPDYSIESNRAVKDTRTSLYWNPKIYVNTLEGTEISFYTGDIQGRYRLIIEGLTHDGKIVMETKDFIVN
jgi:hypothetical protein